MTLDRAVRLCQLQHQYLVEETERMTDTYGSLKLMSFQMVFPSKAIQMLSQNNVMSIESDCVRPLAEYYTAQHRVYAGTNPLVNLTYTLNLDTN